MGRGVSSSINLKVLGISNVVISGLYLAMFVAMMFDMNSLFAGAYPEDGMRIFVSVLTALILGVPPVVMIAAGIGYLLKRRWSRIVGYILTGVMALVATVMLLLSAFTFLRNSPSAERKDATIWTVLAFFILGYCVWTWVSMRAWSAENDPRPEETP